MNSISSLREIQSTNEKLRLSEIPITDDNVALNVMVGFLDTAQKRGAYSMDESAKIWECVKRFIQKQQSKMQ